MQECYQHTDLKWRLSKIPDWAACRGLFFNMMDDRAAEFGPAIQQEYRNYFKIFRFMPFKLYSVRDYLTRMVKLSQLKYGGPNIHQGIHDLQFNSWPAWRKTLMGRATVGLLGKDFSAVLKMAKTTTSMSINYGGMDVEGGPTHFVTHHKNEYVYVDHAMVGGIKGIAHVCDTEIQLVPQMVDPFNGSLEIRVISKRQGA